MDNRKLLMLRTLRDQQVQSERCLREACFTIGEELGENRIMLNSLTMDGLYNKVIVMIVESQEPEASHA